MQAFNTLAEAYNWYMRSEFRDWDWFPRFDEEQLVHFLYRHSNGSRSGEHLVMLFLQCHGQDLTQYVDPIQRQRAGCCVSCGMVPWQMLVQTLVTAPSLVRNHADLAPGAWCWKNERPSMPST